MQLLEHVCSTSERAKKVLTQAPHLLGDTAFFCGAREGPNIVRNTAAVSLGLASALVERGMLRPTELRASGLAHAAFEAASCTAWQADDLHPAAQPNTVVARSKDALAMKLPP